MDSDYLELELRKRFRSFTENVARGITKRLPRALPCEELGAPRSWRAAGSALAAPPGAAAAAAAACVRAESVCVESFVLVLVLVQDVHQGALPPREDAGHTS